MDGTSEGSFGEIQPNIPTCARQAGLNATAADASFAENRPRPAGDFRLYKRYVQIISMPNSLYIPE